MSFSLSANTDGRRAKALAERHARLRELPLVALFFLVAAIVTTYPLIRKASYAIPGGLGDPAMVTFLLAWNADRLADGLRGFWDAPFLYPHQHTIAYAEHMFGVAIFTAPLQWLTRNAVLVYNIAFLGSFVLAGVGMYALTRELFGRKDAALLAAIAFVFNPYRASQITHLQVLMAGWMPLALWGLHRYFASGSRHALAAFATAFVLQAWSNGYFLFFFAIATAVVIAVELVSPRLPRVRIAEALAIAGCAIAAALAPFVWGYLRVQRERSLDRGADDFSYYSARLIDYLRISPGGWSWGGLLTPGGPERQLYLGFVAMAFAVSALVMAVLDLRDSGFGIRDSSNPKSQIPNPDTSWREWRRLVVTYALVTLVALWVSMGPGPWRLYDLFYRFIPGFSGMRVPARMATIVDVGLVVLAAAGAARLLARLPRRVAPVVTGALALVVIVEGRLPVSIDPFPPIERRLDRAAYEWLRDSPPGAVIELNIAQQNDFHPYTLIYQFNTLLHRHPIVNGYTGWTSGLQEFLGGPASPFREPGHVREALEALRAIGVQYVLLHWWTYTDAGEPARIMSEVRAASDQYVEERAFQSTFAWRLTGAGSAPVGGSVVSGRRIDPSSFTMAASHAADRLPLIVDGDIETRWLTGTRQVGGEWLEIRFKQPTDVSHLRFETSPRGLVDYPRHLAVESLDEAGSPRLLFDDSVLTRLIASLVVDERRAPIDLELPPNRTSTLRIRQTGQTHRWFWSVHELSLWSRL